jgi:CheY-like chemotaxis protein/HPt (histidine-containing phosphotransfer) domain-containing protein
VSSAHHSRFAIPPLVALLLAVLWALAGYRAYADRERVVAAKEVELTKLVVAVEEQTLRMLRLTEATLITTSRWIEEHPGVYPGQDPSFIDLVSNLRRLSDDTLEIRIMDAKGGAHVVPAPTRAAVASLADREHFRVQQDPRTRGLFVSDPVLSHVNARWAVPVSYPVLGANPQFAAVAVAIQIERMARPFEAQRLKPNGSVTLIKTNGATLFRTPAIEGSIGKNISQAPDFIEHLNARERGVYRVKGAFDGVERMIGHARLTSYPVIIAVTASAMQGVGQRCREAGMDDYLSKPLRLNDLEAMLNEWLPLRSADAAAALPAWDAGTLTKMIGDSVTVRHRVLEKFLKSSQESVEQMAALVNGHCGNIATALADAAHKLKSGARTVGALALGELCQQMEAAGRAGDSATASALALPVKMALAGASDLIRRELDRHIVDKLGV